MHHMTVQRWGIDVKQKVVHRRGMARDDPYFRLRIPEDLKARVQKAAEANKRSMTAEIIARLDESFSSDRKYTEQDILRIMDALEEATKKLRENTRAQESFLATLFSGQESMADTVLGRSSPKKPKP